MTRMTSPLTDVEIEAWTRDPRLAVRTAARLARKVRGYHQGRLVPANAELAREWEISESTAGRAKALLAERGVIKKDSNWYYTA
jgi:DNA-binding GntR family transcriptional regulator